MGMKDKFSTEGKTMDRGLMTSMSEPFNGYKNQSTTEKFQTLNRRRKHDRILDKASKVVLWMVWIALGSTIIAQVVICIGHHHGLR